MSSVTPHVLPDNRGLPDRAVYNKDGWYIGQKCKCENGPMCEYYEEHYQLVRHKEECTECICKGGHYCLASSHACICDKKWKKTYSYGLDGGDLETISYYLNCLADHSKPDKCAE